MKTILVISILSAVALGLGMIAAAERAGKLPCCADIASTSASASTSPLVCTLTSGEMRQRRDNAHALLMKAATGVEEIEDGYVVTFEKGHGASIAEFIELERACCRFFEFTLTFAADDGPITLAITGPDGSKAFLSEMFQRVSKEN